MYKEGVKMYLHIGKNCVIKNNSIIGIFGIDSIEDTQEYKDLLESLNNINDISDGQRKTFILTKERDILCGYISNIGTNTIKKRKM